MNVCENANTLRSETAEIKDEELNLVTGGVTLENHTRDGHIAVVCAELPTDNVEPATNRNARPSPNFPQ